MMLRKDKTQDKVFSAHEAKNESRDRSYDAMTLYCYNLRGQVLGVERGFGHSNPIESRFRPGTASIDPVSLLLKILTESLKLSSGQYET